MTVIGIDATITGYDNRTRYVSINTHYDNLYRDDRTIKHLVAMCIKCLTGLKLDDILYKAYFPALSIYCFNPSSHSAIFIGSSLISNSALYNISSSFNPVKHLIHIATKCFIVLSSLYKLS